MARLVFLLWSPSRVGSYGCLGLATVLYCCACLLVSLQAASSQSWQGRAGGWSSGTRAFSGLLRWLVFQGVSDAAGTRAKPIDNAAMAKKTKAKAPAKKPSAAKAKKPSASSSGAVVEVEACKS